MKKIHYKINNGNHLQKPTLTKVAQAVLAILSSSAHANSDKLVNPANSHAYQRLDSALEWNTAKSVCSNMGAHLATITSQAENTWVTTNFTNGVVGFWLGATDEVQEGTWKWITNETWSYTNWDSGEPNDTCGGEDYLHMYGGSGMWNDQKVDGSCSSYGLMYPVCEWEPTTTPVVVYSNDFSTSTGAEWTDPTIATSNGEKFLGTNAHGFGPGSNTLTLNNLPTHTKVTVDFDLYMIQTWDGNSGNLGGPDNWQLTADSSNLLLTNFGNYTGNNQAYPNQLSPYGSGGSFAPYTGAFESGHLGFGTGDWGDATYRLSYTFAHTAASVALKFTSMQSHAPGDEGWGLDNVRVSVTPPPVALPVVSTNLPIVVTATTAKLSGTVNPKGAVTTASFDFGTTTSYGTNIAATPTTIPATAGATAISADQTGLNCGATYHYRAKGINSAGTSNGNDQSFTTSSTCNPTAWLYPTNPIAKVGTAFNLDVTVNSNGVKVGAYDFTLNFDQNKLVVDTTQCDQGVCPADGMPIPTVLTDNAAGTIKAVGLSAAGVGPSNDLSLLVIRLQAKSSAGTTPVNLAINELVAATAEREPIGNGVAQGATVNIITYQCGDADGNGAVNIVDALAIARKMVGLPPPPTVSVAADVDGNGRISITDALAIARYSVGLLVINTCFE